MKINKLLSVSKIRESFTGGAVTLRRRLLVFLLILMVTMLAGIMFLLSVFGVFRFGSGTTEQLARNELSHLAADTSKQYGSASVQAVRMSERLSAAFLDFVKEEGLSNQDWQSRPALLEPLLREMLPVLLNNLDITDCSGVFVTLDATVNPAIAAAERSRAGLYIRTIEPNISGMGTEARYLLRGPSSLSGSHFLNLQAKWDLEFNVQDQLFWSEPLKACEAYPALSLSRLVYWCSMSPVPGLSEEVMVCSVPLLDDAGRPWGVCGFEISQMNFMLRYEPEVSGFHKGVFLFASAGEPGPDDLGEIRLEEALYSGNVAVYGAFPKQGRINRGDKGEGFGLCQMPDGASYVGLEQEIKLYPADSPFAGQQFLAALLFPKEELDAAQSADTMRFGLILLVLTVMGGVVSLVLSKRYVKPIIETLSSAGEDGLPEKTNIIEIDQLLEKIKKLRPQDHPLPDNLFEDFIVRVKTLTPTEMKIFRHYAEGKKGSEIVALMFFTTHTLKMHNKHIYQKLDVSSKDELMLYVELIKRSGMEERIL